MNDQPIPKIETLRAHMAAGEWNAAISLASKFQNLGDAHVDVKRAQDAITNPDFARQIGRDPHTLIQCGIAALKRRYDK